MNSFLLVPNVYGLKHRRFEFFLAADPLLQGVIHLAVVHLHHLLHGIVLDDIFLLLDHAIPSVFLVEALLRENCTKIIYFFQKVSLV